MGFLAGRRPMLPKNSARDGGTSGRLASKGSDPMDAFRTVPETPKVDTKAVRSAVSDLSGARYLLRRAAGNLDAVGARRRHLDALDLIDQLDQMIALTEEWAA